MIMKCFAVFSMCVLIATLSCNSPVKATQPDNFAVPTSASAGAAPFQIITLGTSSFGDNDRISVEFSDNGGYRVRLPASYPNPLQVQVPIYINPATFHLDSGRVFLTVYDSTMNGVQTYKVGMLKIAAPPTLPGVAPGKITDLFLISSGTFVTNTQTLITRAGAQDSALVDTSNVMNVLGDAKSKLGTMETAVSNFLATGGASNASIGSSVLYGNLKMDSATMTNSDRIIAAFLLQIAPVSTAKMLAGAASSEDPTDIQNLAQTWYQSMTAEISQGTLDMGKKIGGAYGTLGAVGAVVAVIAGAPEIGTACAIIGAIGFCQSTFIPAAYSMYLTLGSDLMLTGQANLASVKDPLGYMAGNMAATAVGTIGEQYISQTSGDVTAAVVGMVDNCAGFSDKVGSFVGSSLSLVISNGGGSTLPKGFPTIPTGTYNITLQSCTNGSCTNSSGGQVTCDNVSDYAQTVENQLNSVAAAWMSSFGGSSGCTCSSSKSFTPWTGTSFTATVSVSATCCSDGDCVTTNMSFAIMATKQ
jgi:hypothetical protein